MYDLDFKDAVAQARKLDDFPKIAQREFTRAMQGAVAISVIDLKARSPIGTGRLASSTSGEIRYAVGDDVRAVMSTSARGANGFPYGYALDASKKYRYQGKRKRTYRWFRGVRTRKRKEIMALFAGALERIVERLAIR